MKTTKRLLITSAFLLLGGYSLYTTVRIQQLETRPDRHQIDRTSVRYGLHPQLIHRGGTLGISYAFDDSFRQYFGEKGVAEVERAFEILRNPKTVPAPQIEKPTFDFLSDPLRVDGI